MTTRTLLTAAIALGTASAAAAMADTAMLPGYYETVTRTVGKAGGTTTRDCLSPAEARTETVERKLQEALRAPGCKYTQRSLASGKFALAGSCNQAGMKSSFKQTGTYSPTGMTMNNVMTMSLGGKPINLSLVINSRRIAATCPAGER
jgi:hypothetical protein